MLKQLPISGDWIDPADIRGVSAHDRRTDYNGEERPAYYSIRMYDGSGLGFLTNESGPRYAVRSVDCPDGYEQAKAARDEIAGWANTVAKEKENA